MVILIYMFKFLITTKRQRKDQAFKDDLIKALFNPKRHKKIVKLAIKKSSEDQNKVLVKYQELIQTKSI